LFTISYLKGLALSWFEPGLTDPTNSSHWIWDFEAFLSKHKDNFSPHNPVSDAEKSLTELSMKKTIRIVKYNVSFWELASRVSWNKSALHDQYFHGLLLWLCMEVLHGGKPNTLAALHLKAQDADNIYWMQEEESCLESKTSGNNGNLSKKDLSKNSNSSSSLKSPSNNNLTSTSFKSSSKGMSKDKPKNSISDKLGKNGKLTRDERECHMKEGLYLYCGEKGHVAQDCPKSAVAKACLLKVLAPAPKADSMEPKK
jgi:Zinc knuckle